ncbi:MAG TPA: hypothetical protein PLO51_05770, partial [Candidatus Micrarchaeota archaeon]|nr:hypothetical protein [Candidatus Micrarchaeota archaeon]
SVTTLAWNGSLGGIIAMKVNGTLTVSGSIIARGTGYRTGDTSVDVSSCSSNLLTGAGESISGPSGYSTSAHVGGAGGFAALSGVSFASKYFLTSTGGFRTAGSAQAGVNDAGRTAGAAGGTYGGSDGSRLYLGSGGAGGISCDAIPSIIYRSTGNSAGGIILLYARNLNISGGVINSSGADNINWCYGSGTGSGGSVAIIAQNATLGSGHVSAKGGICGCLAYNPSLGTISGGDGFVTVKYSGSLSGSSNPAINSVLLPRSSNFSGLTNIDSAYSDLLPGLVLDSPGKGTIRFPSGYSVNVSGQDYDSNVIIENGFVAVNSSALNPTFNSTATLTLNLTGIYSRQSAPTIYYYEPFASSLSSIVSNGAVCSAPR